MKWQTAWMALVLACAGCARAKLDLDPAVVSGCPGRRAVVQVHWDASASGAEWVKIDLQRPGEPMRPWIETSPKGSQRTGQWASDGLTFVLLSGKGRELARRTIEATPCTLPSGE